MFLMGAPKHRVAFIVPCYNVAHNVKNLVERMAQQTIREPIDIILSDHGSYDGTLRLFKEAYRYYSKTPGASRHNFSVFKALRNTFGATIGAVHDHVNQLMMAIDSEFIILGTGDDDEHKERASKLVEAYDKTGAGFITNSQMFTYPPSIKKEPTVSRGTGITRWIEIEETIVEHWDHPSLNGSSAWSKDLWREFGPLDLHAANDIIMPLWGCLHKGTFHIGGVYKNYKVTGNQTGLGARYQFETNVYKKLQLAELMCFERMSLAMHVRTLIAAAIQKTIYSRHKLISIQTETTGPETNHGAEIKKLTDWLDRLNRCYAIATEVVVKRSEDWTRCRARLVAEGLAPLDYKLKTKPVKGDANAAPVVKGYAV